ncbi:antitermination protein N [Pantoea cypripedii]|uniref:Antitermination protein n=1 Tax=Pantoea cypripedii TaxID=55209 RepID=A0A6B9G3D7_PANCY|nr:antitermination protein N [Pantoea cypripedii]QGY29793.1 antitermination protein [Pantoea cypripedii]
MNAQERRRAARAEKQSAWKQANPLLVGVKAKPDCRPILTLNRKPTDRVVKAVDTDTEYHKQILAGAAAYVEYRSNPKHQKVTNEAGRQIHAVQRQRGKSIPLV